MNDNLNFYAWLSEVNRIMISSYHCSIDSLPDCLYKDWHQLGMTPEKAVENVWSNFLNQLEVD